MKTLVAFLSLSAAVLSAAPLTAQWDANPEPVKKYEVFLDAELHATVDPATPGASFVDTSTQKPTVQIAIDAGPGQVLTVRAVSPLGFVGPFSDPFTLEAAPGKVGGFRVRLSFTLERSNDLGEWAEAATITIPQPNSLAAFYRTK